MRENCRPHTISVLAAEESRMHLNNCCARTHFLALSYSRQAFSLPLIVLACGVIASCDGSSTESGPITSMDSTTTPSSSASTSVHTNTFFAASPANSRAWGTGAAGVSVTPGTLTSVAPNGTMLVSPASTTTYTLSAKDSSGSTTDTVTVAVTPKSASPLTIATTKCPGGKQGTVYAGCTISVSGGTSPYTFSVSTNANYAPLPEGLSLNATTGRITSSRIGGQGTYGTLLVVRDATNAQATH